MRLFVTHLMIVILGTCTIYLLHANTNEQIYHSSHTIQTQTLEDQIMAVFANCKEGISIELPEDVFDELQELIDMHPNLELNGTIRVRMKAEEEDLNALSSWIQANRASFVCGVKYGFTKASSD